MKPMNWLGIILAAPAAYLALCGGGWVVEAFKNGQEAFGIFHPLLALFLVTGVGSVIAFDKAEQQGCLHCSRMNFQLGEVRHELDETRQALMVLKDPS